MQTMINETTTTTMNASTIRLTGRPRDFGAAGVGGWEGLTGLSRFGFSYRANFCISPLQDADYLS